jgi:hypothetical protein
MSLSSRTVEGKIEPPRWIRENLRQIHGLYAILQLGPNIRPRLVSQIPSCANMPI